MMSSDGPSGSSRPMTPHTHGYPNGLQSTLAAPQELRREKKPTIDCHYILKSVFGHTSFKGKQAKICQMAVQGADIFVLAPTGMGKSVCFQVPSVAHSHGITIVVSPLLSLMKNQVSKLRQLQVEVAAYTSETKHEEKDEIIKQLKSGHPLYRMLYITPESLCSNRFMQIVQTVYDNKELNRLVIDEAHCLSEWGHDFRPDYRKLKLFRERFPDTPIMALTATATPDVQDDIAELLGINTKFLYKVVHNFNRENLYYEIRYTAAPHELTQMTDIFETIQKLHMKRGQTSSGIIYCRTRKMCDTLSTFLRGKGINSRPFHRGVSSTTLDNTLIQWEHGGFGDNAGVDVVVATIAFGMGIDKSNVRYVIHYDMPKTLEGYYQETGRAGRDSALSRCILYYSREDYLRVAHFAKQGKNAASLKALLKFCEDVETCRHITICRYFGEVIDEMDEEQRKAYCDNMCDVCRNPEKVKQRKQILSSEEFASTQVMANPGVGEEDEDGYPRQTTSKKRTLPVAPPPIKRSATGTLGMSRSSTSAAPGPSKKARYDPMPPTLNTKPHASEKILFKPFKPPSMSLPLPGPSRVSRTSASRRVSRNVPWPPIVIESPSPRHTPPLLPEEDEDDVPMRSEPSPRVHDAQPLVDPDDDSEVQVLETSRSPSPTMEIPDKFALDVSSSMKVPHDQRIEGCKALYRALYKALSTQSRWSKMTYEPASTEAKNEVLTATSEELECSAQSMCTTSAGYAVRIEDTVRAVKLISKNSAWVAGEDEGYEDAREVVTVLQKICTRRRKGKGKKR